MHGFFTAKTVETALSCNNYTPLCVTSTSKIACMWRSMLDLVAVKF